MRYYVLLLFTLVFFIKVNTQESNCACCTDKHSEFSFWEGEWEVSSNGKKAGVNTLKFIQQKCILQENWVSSTPDYTGTSHSFYNSAKDRWEQLWIDNQGLSLYLKGNKKDNQMILQTDKAVNKNGNEYINRITWTENSDGTVRQLWEVIIKTSEGNKTSIAFDGLYKRKN